MRDQVWLDHRKEGTDTELIQRHRMELKKVAKVGCEEGEGCVNTRI
jgi:hypothetical protein